MKINKIVSLLLIGLLVISCNKGVDAPDVSHIKVDIKVQPFYKDLFELDVNQLPEQFPALRNKYGPFVEAYSQRIINIGSPDAERYYDYLKSFLEYDANKDVLKKCEEVFGNTQALNEELSQAFRYLKYYFPNHSIPDIYLHISGFNQSIAIDSTWLSISIENYFGADCKFYEWLSPPVPVYLRGKMIPEKVVPDVMKALAMTEYPSEMQHDDVISRMIEEGKLLYFVRHMLPAMDDSLLFDFSQEQLNWCQKYESDLWAGMVERKHLYNSERMIIQKYVGDSPFTYYYGQDSPGRAAVFLGYKIIEAFMDEQSDLTLFQLMNEKDAHKILRLSRYRP